MDILLNGEQVDAFSFIVHRDFSYERGKAIVEKLRKLSQDNSLKCLYKQPSDKKLSHVRRLSRWVKTFLLNVTAEISLVNVNLLEKQKEGKKRMKQVGSVEVPQEAFMAVLKMDED